MKKIKQILLFIWQLPQNILGLILFWWYKRISTRTHRDIYKGVNYLFTDKIEGAISLGNYVIVNYIHHSYRHSHWEDSEKVIKHEYGHTRQSLMFGPLYILLIGYQSIIHAGFHRFLCHGKDYHHFWTEKWADKLGGVKR